MKEYLVRLNLEGFSNHPSILGTLKTTLELAYDSEIFVGKKNGNLYFWKEV